MHNHVTHVLSVKANHRLRVHPGSLRVIFLGLWLICHLGMACEVNRGRKMLFFFWKLFLLKDLPICLLESSMRLLHLILSFFLLWPLKPRTVQWCKVITKPFTQKETLLYSTSTNREGDPFLPRPVCLSIIHVIPKSRESLLFILLYGF